MLYFFAHNFFVPVRIVFKKKTLRFCFAVENSGSSSFSFHSWTEFKKKQNKGGHLKNYGRSGGL